MKTKPAVIEKQLGKDLKSIEQLPAKTRELLSLETEAEQSTGQKSADVHAKIREVARPVQARKSGPKP